MANNCIDKEARTREVIAQSKDPHAGVSVFGRGVRTVQTPNAKVKPQPAYGRSS